MERYSYFNILCLNSHDILFPTIPFIFLVPWWNVVNRTDYYGGLMFAHLINTRLNTE